MLCIVTFVVCFGLGIWSKTAIRPSWAKKYTAKMSDEIGTVYTDIACGEGEANRFDLYVPEDKSRDSYGLVVYLHAGGFTSGDKSGDVDILSWLCKKGYVSAGINYTLRTKDNNASVYLQSMEIKTAIPVVIEEAGKLGYHIDRLAMAGGSAGHTLAMIYAYREAEEAPVPVALTFGAVGPSSFYREDWGVFGIDQNTEESMAAAADLFSVMSGENICVEEIKDGTYLKKVKPISAADWITKDSAPTVVAYGAFDRVQPYKASFRLRDALDKNGVDHQYFVLPHSGHGLQNDDAVSRRWMEAVEKYLAKYMPVQ